MFRNMEELKIIRAYESSIREKGYDIALKDDIYLQQLHTYRRDDEAYERDEDRKALFCPLEDINTVKYPSAVCPSAETELFGELIDDDEYIEELKAIISTLSPLQKKRIYKHFYYEISLKEIALEENVSYEAVRETVYKGLQKLKNHSDFLQKLPLKKWIHLFE